MADPQTAQAADQGNWIQYGMNRRYNPDTGEVQYDLKGTGDWQSVAQLGQYNPQNPLQGLTNPNLLSDPTISQAGATDPNQTLRQFLVNQGGWSLPSADTLQQINMMRQMAAQGQSGQGQPGAATGQSYWGSPSQINMGGAWAPPGMAPPGMAPPGMGPPGMGPPGMAGGPPGSAPGPGAQGAQGAQGGGTQSGGNMAQGLPSGTQASTAEQLPAGVSIPEWQAWYGRNIGKTMMVNGRSVTLGQDIGPDQLINAFQSGNANWNTQNVPQPESLALQQMAQIDPVSEALRGGLGASYLANLGGGPPAPQFGGMPQFNMDLSRGAAAPNAADVQSYLNLYKQIDPSGYAQRAALAGQMGSYLNQMQQQAALGSKLTTGQAREVDQATREAQAARGNVYGTPQLTAEAMTRGQYGIQLEQQRQQMLGQALGQQQSYLTSGAGLGDVANQLYNQGVSRYLQGFGTQANAALQGYGAQLQGWQAQQNARLQSQGAALGYLGSGQTPFQAGSSYLNQAQQNAAQAAQGGPQYNPASLGQQYTGAGASSFPQYGLDMSQLAGNWYNNINQANLQAYGLQQAYGQKSGGNMLGAGVGALGGAASGALAGSAVPGIGTAIGAIGGALAGGLSGYSK